MDKMLENISPIAIVSCNLLKWIGNGEYYFCLQREYSTQFYGGARAEASFKE